MINAMQDLLPQLREIIASSGAEIGLSVLHLESDESINVNAETSFPMASVLKIPVLCEAFRQMENGEFQLDDRWELTYPVKNIGSGILTYLRDGLEPTVYDLLLMMIVISDNTATDMVMNRVGVERIDDYMKSLGLKNIHLPTNIRGLFHELVGEDASDPSWLLDDLTQEKDGPETRRESAAYSDGPDNNVSTPQDMTHLLAMIYRGQVVNRSACDAMLHIMLQQQINLRLPRFIPSTVPFAHKTGTLSGIRNNAGILYASTSNHIAITAFSRWDAAAVEDDLVAQHDHMNQVDTALGHIGRIIYGHFS